jgi:hypothetical protein
MRRRNQRLRRASATAKTAAKVRLGAADVADRQFELMEKIKLRNVRARGEPCSHRPPNNPCSQKDIGNPVNWI